MSKENKPLSPYAEQPASQGYINCLVYAVEIIEAARTKKGLKRKTVKTLNGLLTWLLQYRRAIEHSLTHWAATDKANAETGLGTDLDTVLDLVSTLKAGGVA